MNQKLQDLMYHSGLTAQGCWDEMDEYDKQAIEKFAELIVRECVDRIKRVGILEDIEIEGDMISDAVKEHFGVKND